MHRACCHRSCSGLEPEWCLVGTVSHRPRFGHTRFCRTWIADGRDSKGGTQLGRAKWCLSDHASHRWGGHSHRLVARSVAGYWFWIALRSTCRCLASSLDRRRISFRFFLVRPRFVGNCHPALGQSVVSLAITYGSLLYDCSSENPPMNLLKKINTMIDQRKTVPPLFITAPASC